MLVTTYLREGMHAGVDRMYKSGLFEAIYCFLVLVEVQGRPYGLFFV